MVETQKFYKNGYANSFRFYGGNDSTTTKVSRFHRLERRRKLGMVRARFEFVFTGPLLEDAAKAREVGDVADDADVGLFWGFHRHGHGM